MVSKLKLFLSCIFFTLLIACSGKHSGDIHDTDGNVVTLSQLKGKWVIINYWAAWCETCIKEIPQLNQFNQTHDPDVVMYGVNFDQPTFDELKKAMTKAGIRFPVLVEDPGGAWHLDDVTVLPTTFILSPDGNVVRKIIGASTQKSLMAALKQAKAAR